MRVIVLQSWVLAAFAGLGCKRHDDSDDNDGDGGPADASLEGGGAVGGRDAGAEQDGAVGLGLAPCEDGTGAADCCSDRIASGDCPYEDLVCWTPCIFSDADRREGMRSQRFCTAGSWSAGHGLFPCEKAVE